MMLFLQRRKPRRPKGVRLITPDGDEIPHELEYAGREDGQHVWHILPERLPPYGTCLEIDRLPGGTSIGFPMAVPPRDRDTTPEGHT